MTTEMSQVGQSQYGSNYGSHYGGGAGTTAYNKPKFTRTGTKVDIQGQEAAAPPKNPQVEVEEIERARGEQIAFVVLLVLFEVAMLIIMGVWFDYVSDAAAIVENKELYPYIRDVFIMVVVGFGFLMTFLRRCGFSSLGFTLLITAMVTQWSLIVGAFFKTVNVTTTFDPAYSVGMEDVLDGLFCSATVLISYGAIIGKTTPTQLLLMMFIEPMFFWVNVYVILMQLEVYDIGGGYTIHTFGAIYGLSLCWFFSSKKFHGHADNTSAYLSDVTSLIGTTFLFIMWPSFNAVLAHDRAHIIALINTFYSLMGATAATFLISRMFPDGKIEIVCVQNSVLAGGVVMGCAAHLDITIAGATASGFIAGCASTLGFRKLLRILDRYLHIQDVCGIVNLHGIPGILSGLVSIIAAGALCDSPNDFAHGCTQAAYQTAGLFISIGFALAGGVITGLISRYMLAKLNHLAVYQLFNDQPFFHSPTDYDMTGMFLISLVSLSLILCVLIFFSFFLFSSTCS